MNPRNLKLFIASWIILLSGHTISNAHASIPVSLSEYASDIIGKPVKVHCQIVPRGMFGYTLEIIEYDLEHPNGVTSYDPDIYLSPDTCANLEALRQSRIVSYYWQAMALGTFIHETYHIRLNNGDESLVECTTMANIWNYINRYGFSTAQKKKLYIKSWEAHLSLPEDYLQGCRNPPKNLKRYLNIAIIGPIYGPS